MKYSTVIRNLRRAYDLKVDERDQREVAGWKKQEREAFLGWLGAEGARTLLEIGAGTGVHGLFFQGQGIDVVCTDLSRAMVEHCREKGLKAYMMDFLNLDFPPGNFDAVFAMNCLLHVPKVDLPQVFGEIYQILKPAGLFYLGQYGGVEQAGVYSEDHYRPRRFFSFLTDEGIQQLSGEFFELLSFRAIPLPGEDERHFQSLILRRRNL